MMQRTYYEVIGAIRSSTKDEISHLYRLRCRELHPDKQATARHMQELQLLQEAYSVLSDDTRRTHYDAWLQSGISSEVDFVTWERMRVAGGVIHWHNPDEPPQIAQSTDAQPDNDAADADATAAEESTRQRQLFKKYLI